MFKLLDDDIRPFKDRIDSPDDPFIKISGSTARLVRNSGSRFTIGIYGEWGTGKTTLMKLIEDELKSFIREDKITLSWGDLLKSDSGELTKYKNLNNQFKLSWINDSKLLYTESDETIVLINENVYNEKSLKKSRRKRLFSALPFLFNADRTKMSDETHQISLKYNGEKNEAVLRVGDYYNILSTKKEPDGKITLHLKEGEILTVWFDAWRYEREEYFALIALMKTIAYAMADLPYYQNVKKILLRGIGIIGKDVLRHFTTQYAMTNEGWDDLDQKLLPQMDLLSKVDKDTIYFDGLQKIKEEMRKITNIHKIVVFIDDLDRCNSTKALEVFESTKAFLDIEGFIFVIGLSIDTLYKLFRKEYEGVGIKGEEYIRKIIQVYINIPTWDRKRIDALVDNISNMLGESDHELFQDRDLIAKAANNNPREVKRVINRYTISNYLDEIDATIFLIIQAFENRWYENLYKKLEDKDYLDLLLHIYDTDPTRRDALIKEKRNAIATKGLFVTDDEKALVGLGDEFWKFFDDPKYHDTILNIIKNWGQYKEKYTKSAEPTQDIKSVSREGISRWLRFGQDDIELSDKKILTNNIMRELCQSHDQIHEKKYILIEDMLSIQAFDRRYIERFLESFEKQTHFIERPSAGRIRLTDTGEKYCSMFV